MTMATLLIENIYFELAYIFRILVHDYHGGKHGRMQAEMVVEIELSTIHLDPQAEEGNSMLHWT